MTAFQPVGVVRTSNTSHDDTPVQTVLNWEETAEIHLDPSYRDGLHGLADFSHLWVLTWLMRPNQPIGPDTKLIQTPFLLRPTGAEVGVFAMRGPNRPNPFGLHLVRIEAVQLDPPVITFRGVDMIDGTPVVDIKPWVARFDLPPEPKRRSGWYDTLDIQETTPADLATRGKEQER